MTVPKNIKAFSHPRAHWLPTWAEYQLIEAGVGESDDSPSFAYDGWKAERSIVGRYQARTALQEGAAPGSAVVGPEYPTTFFEAVRSASVVLQAGPMVAPMQTATCVIPVITTGSTGHSTAEDVELTEQEPTIGAVSLTAKKVALVGHMTSEYASDSREDVRRLLEGDLAAGVAYKLDQQLLAGDGTGEEMVGLRNLGNEVHVAADGDLVDLAAIQGIVKRVLVAGGSLPTMAFFTSPRVLADILRLDVSTAPAGFIDLSGSVPRISGVRTYTSDAIAVDEVVGGSGAACSSLICADMRAVLCGMRQYPAVRMSSTGAGFAVDVISYKVTARADVQPVRASGAMIEVLDGITEDV